MSSHERAHDDPSNNVTYQRSLYAYEYARPLIKGKKVADIGCGNAYGTALMAADAASIVGVDYDQQTLDENRARYKNLANLSFERATVPPIPFPDNSFDVVTTFQFIEHIHQRREFMIECLRILKPGGTVIITTPNIKRSLARNPYHIHEYTFAEMQTEAGSVTPQFDLQGLNGNEAVRNYYEENGKFVRMILRWDILGLHKILPAKLVAVPYNWITSLMRNKLQEKVKQTTQITTKDWFLQKDNLDECWDIFLTIRKN